MVRVRVLVSVRVRVRVEGYGFYLSVSELTRPTQLRSKQAAAGVWWRSPLEGG